METFYNPPIDIMSSEELAARARSDLGWTPTTSSGVGVAPLQEENDGAVKVRVQ